MSWKSFSRIARASWPSWAALAVAILLATSGVPAMAQTHGDSVWVNTHSGVYHCPGTHSYGTSKHGQYMAEATAVSRGFRPAKGRSCAAREAARHAAATPAHDGQVWVDTQTHVYRCPGAKKYGSGAGVYMTEPAAVAAGNRPAKGRGCQ